MTSVNLWLRVTVAFVLAGFVIRGMDHGWTASQRKHVPIALQGSNIRSTPISNAQKQCLTMDKGGNFDNLLARYKQVYFVMPAKAAGSTIKHFVIHCMEEANTNQIARYDNILNRNYKPGYDLLPSISDKLEMPTMIASHLYDHQALVDLSKQVTRDSLIIYIHREETARMKSSITQLVQFSEVCKNVPEDQDCQFTEDDLVRLITRKTKKKNELTFSMQKILTCETYDAIEENYPNFVFMHYKQADRLFKVLSKHHCPNYSSQEMQNAGEHKQKFLVELEHPAGDQKIVELDVWLSHKKQMLEFVYDLKGEVTCQGITRKMEDKLLECPDETLHFSGRGVPNFKTWIEPEFA
jgi:hypothetical protein